MIPAQFTKLIAELEHLTDSQTRYVEKLLKGTDSVSQLITELEERMVENPECPHCHSSLINRHGKVAALSLQELRQNLCSDNGDTASSTEVQRALVRIYSLYAGQ